MKRTNKIVLSVLVSVLFVVALSLSIVLPLAAKGENDATSKALVDLTWSNIADVAEKGGAIYLESGANYVMKGGEISNKGNTYGGAVYVSSGSSFTMEGGTIRNCQARYGGAIYVESGGRCVINGGSIVDNESTVAPAIYLEEGARLTVGNVGLITNNRISDNYLFMRIHPEQKVGDSSSALYCRVVYYGHYPRSYVGNKMNQTLEDWYQENMPEVDTTYTLMEQVWHSYKYTDGKYYIRGTSKIGSNAEDRNAQYLNGDYIKKNGEICWFQMQPMKWYITNYDNWVRGIEYMRLLSEIVVAANVRFNEPDGSPLWVDSELRTWLNTEFLNTAFTAVERAKILTTEVLNNVPGDYSSSTSDGKGETTYDKIYLRSYYEMVSDIFSMPLTEYYTYYRRYCSPSDFALSNAVNSPSASSTSSYGRNLCYYFTRTAYSNTEGKRYVVCFYGSSTYTDIPVDYSNMGIRPSMRIDINSYATVS